MCVYRAQRPVCHSYRAKRTCLDRDGSVETHTPVPHKTAATACACAHAVPPAPVQTTVHCLHWHALEMMRMSNEAVVLGKPAHACGTRRLRTPCISDPVSMCRHRVSMVYASLGSIQRGSSLCDSCDKPSPLSVQQVFREKTKQKQRNLSTSAAAMRRPIPRAFRGPSLRTGALGVPVLAFVPSCEPCRRRGPVARIASPSAPCRA